VLDDDDASLSVVVQRMPPILGCSIETNLEPTTKFYKECVRLDAARTLVANNLRLLGSSLEKRLERRHAEFQEADIPIDKGAVEPMAVGKPQGTIIVDASFRVWTLKKRKNGRRSNLPSDSTIACLLPPNAHDDFLYILGS
jgi:hypothetical protein